jgi:hypothetical protein
MDYLFFGLGEILDWGNILMGLFFNGERNCGGWGKIWLWIIGFLGLGFLGLGFLDEIWGMLWWRINRIKMS